MDVRTVQRLWTEHPRWRRRLVRTAVAGAIVAAVLIAIPLAVERYAEGWLRERGASGAVIGDVDLNPFTGVLRVRRLDAGASGARQLAVRLAEVNLQWLALLRGRVRIEALRVADVRADIRSSPDGGFEVGGLRFPPAAAGAPEAEETPPAGEPWGFGSERVHLENVVVTYADAQLDTVIHLRELALGPHATWRPGESTDLRVEMTVDGSALRLTSDVAPWSDAPRLSGTLRLEDLELTAYERLLAAAAGVREPRGRLSADLELELVYEQGHVRLESTGPLELYAAELGDGTNRLQHARMRWEGVVDLAWPPDETRPLAAVDGALRLEGARVVLPELGVETELGEARWSGSLRYSPAAEGLEETLAGESSLSLRGWHVDHPELDVRLVEAAGVSVDGIALAGRERVSIGAARVGGLALLGAPSGSDGDTVLAVERIEMREVDADPARRVEVAEVVVTRPRLRVVREPDGALRRIDAVQRAFTDAGGARADDAAGAAEAGDGEDAPAPVMAVVVRSLRIVGDEWLRFEDRSLETPTTIGFDALEVELTNVDTTGGEPMRIAAMTAQGDRTRIDVDGTARVLGTPMSADVQVDVRGLDLPQLSPYVPGYNVQRGRLSSDSRARVDGDRLDVDNELLIERLELAGKTDSAVAAQGLAMPLDVALDLLRDRNDQIRLELPITGSLDDPQFGTGAIVRRAIQGALQKAALSYVKNALQPLGTILFVKNLASAAARPRFEPVTLPPGSAELPDTARAYLGKIGAMLGERPKLQLTMCGVATARDREVLVARAREAATAAAAAAAATATETAGGGEEAGGSAVPGPRDAPDEEPAAPVSSEPLVSEAELVELARLRTAAALRFLAERERVARERLFACRETYEGEDAEPRVEITL